MKNIAANAGFGLGAISLFALSFVTFTALSGTPLHEVAVIKNFVKPPEEASESATIDPQSDPVDRLSDKELVDGGSSVLRAFLFPAPYDAQGMGKLQDELKTRIRDYGQRLSQLREREAELAQREADIEDRYAELQKLRSALQDFELELTLRGEEVARDDNSRKMREKESWTRLAKLFEEGDVDEQSQRLLTFDPPDAARILNELSLERARSIMDALPVNRYQEFVQAYRDQQVGTVPR